jgi:hypothetical protein
MVVSFIEMEGKHCRSEQVRKMIKKICFATRGLDYEHMIKARAHKGGVRIGKTPKKLASICCR